MSVAAAARTLAALAAAGLAAGCNPPVQGDGDGGSHFQIGTIDFHAVSGAAVETDDGFGLYLSDHPDTCEAISFVPAGELTLFELHVVPEAGGAGRATVVAPDPSPAPGEAMGGLERSGGGIPLVSYTAASGSVEWTARLDGSVTLDAMDVGYEGVEGRVTLSAVELPACAP